MKKIEKMSRLTGELEKAFRLLNTELFNSELEMPIITVIPTPRAYAHYTTVDVWCVDGEGKREINIASGTLDRPLENILASLVHEMVHMPSQFFTLFEQTYICTYLWEGSFQKAYFDMNNIRYVHLMLCEHKLNPYNPTKELMLREDMFKLINLYNKEDLNKIGVPDKKNRYPLTHSWYESKQKKNENALMMIKRNTENYFKHKVNTHSSENMYTTFKRFKNLIKGDGYTKGFVPCNAKATNEFRNKKSLAYLINSYPDVNVVRFFERNGIVFNQDLYAVSELLQWIWRSAIRDGKEINLYLPSQRMRELLGKWALGKT